MESLGTEGGPLEFGTRKWIQQRLDRAATEVGKSQWGGPGLEVRRRKSFGEEGVAAVSTLPRGQESSGLSTEPGAGNAEVTADSAEDSVRGCQGLKPSLRKSQGEKLETASLDGPFEEFCYKEKQRTRAVTRSKGKI